MRALLTSSKEVGRPSVCVEGGRRAAVWSEQRRDRSRAHQRGDTAATGHSRSTRTTWRSHHSDNYYSLYTLIFLFILLFILLFTIHLHITIYITSHNIIGYGRDGVRAILGYVWCRLGNLGLRGDGVLGNMGVMGFVELKRGESDRAQVGPFVIWTLLKILDITCTN